MIELFVAGAAAAFGYAKSRNFFREKLRFVDSAHTSKAPVIAGVAATAVAAPLVWILPFVGGVSAVTFGVAVGIGAAKGAKDTRRLNP